MIVLNQNEAELVRRLIKLYEVTDNFTHGSDCGCELCESNMHVGSTHFGDFLSLEDKLENKNLRRHTFESAQMHGGAA